MNKKSREILRMKNILTFTEMVKSLLKCRGSIAFRKKDTTRLTLFNAAMEGNLKMTKSILEENSLEISDISFALEPACIKGHMEILLLLLKTFCRH